MLHNLVHVGSLLYYFMVDYSILAIILTFTLGRLCGCWYLLLGVFGVINIIIPYSIFRSGNYMKKFLISKVTTILLRNWGWGLMVFDHLNLTGQEGKSACKREREGKEGERERNKQLWG